MRTVRKLFAALGLVALGYILGSRSGLPSLLPLANGQEAPSADEEQQAIVKKAEAAILAIDTAMRALIETGGYVPAIRGINGFAVTAGGGDMIQALEQNESVDPETYVGLYAGMAVPEVQEKLGKDESGRLTYNGNVVKMYSIPELKKLYQARLVLADHLRQQQLDTGDNEPPADR